jgi:hypothetical protein
MEIVKKNMKNYYCNLSFFPQIITKSGEVPFVPPPKKLHLWIVFA